MYVPQVVEVHKVNIQVKYKYLNRLKFYTQVEVHALKFLVKYFTLNTMYLRH